MHPAQRTTQSQWPSLSLGSALSGGERSDVWNGILHGERVVVRKTKRSAASFDWELGLMIHLHERGFRVPLPHPTLDGRLHHNGVAVQTWITGDPPTTADEWRSAATELRRLHQATQGYPQRPGCCVVTELRGRRRSVDADLDAMPAAIQQRILRVFESFDGAPTSVVHGDTHSGNVRIDSHGVVGLLDWDESRVDLAWHDLSNLGSPDNYLALLDPADDRRAKALSNAWEAANAWVIEPEYARRRLRNLT